MGGFLTIKINYEKIEYSFTWSDALTSKVLYHQHLHFFT